MSTLALRQWDWLHTGFDGRYTNKAGSTAEGSATFYRRSRFREVARFDLKMKELFAALADGNPAAVSAHAQFLPLLCASPALVKALQMVRDLYLPPTP